MLRSIPLEGPPDLDALEAFLASPAAPEDCMTLSELDGFLAGVIAGPEMVMPSEWLNYIWGDGEPTFNDMDQANAMLGIIMRRYNEIAGQLMEMPPTYRPILTKTEDGKADGSDWAVGFITAMALRQDAWEPLATHPEAGAMLSPIMLVASTTTKANLPLEEDERLPPAEMAKLLANPGPLLGMCATGIRLFFEQPQSRPPRHRRAPAKKQRGARKEKQQKH